LNHLSLIVAMDENRLIGSNNQLPWHLPADLAFFKRTTMGKPIIMGRKTFESIGRPLPGRRNIVVTRNPEFTAAGCDIAGDIDAALAICSADEEVMLIGGASLYEQAIKQTAVMYITRIHHSFSGDTWFPEFNESDWKLTERQDIAADDANQYAYSFVKYVREIQAFLS
jgi:dihydrofolate reductase